MKRILSTGTAALVLAAGLTGCGKDDDKDSGPQPNGVADMKPAEALAKADNAMAALDDFTYKGFLTGDSERMTTTVKTVSGEACEMVMAGKKNGTATFRGVERKTYMKTDLKAAQSLYGVDAATAQLLANRWLMTPADAEARQDCHGETLVPDGALRRSYKAGKTQEIDGREARAFTGKDEDGFRQTLWIATTGEPVVVRVDGRDSDGPSRFTLDATNSGYAIQAPPKKDIIDPAALS